MGGSRSWYCRKEAEVLWMKRNETLRGSLRESKEFCVSLEEFAE
jgi:hypothetical protein